MRKRNLYAQNAKSQSKIPTIIIMCIVLFAILFYGQSMSQRVAEVFVTNEPTVDNHAITNQAQTNETAEPETLPNNDAPIYAGTVVYKANKNAAENLLKVISDQ